MWTVSHSLIDALTLHSFSLHTHTHTPYTLLFSPPLEWFGKPHWNLHVFRVTPEERLNARCADGMANPFICDFPPFEQPTPEGRAFFVWGKDTNDAVANVPDTFTAATDTAVPGEAVHSWDHNLSVPVADWFDPQLIMGLYDGKYYAYSLKSSLFISYLYILTLFTFLLSSYSFVHRRNSLLGAYGE